MQIFSDIDRFDNEGGSFVTAVAVGKFDGIHCGHAKLIQTLKECAEGLRSDGKECRSIVITFSSPVQDFFTGTKSPVLTTNSEKDEYLRDMGIDYEFVLEVNEATVSMSPESFISDIIKKGLHAAAVVAGPDVSFGKSGAGNFKLLSQMADKLDFKAVMVEKIILDGEEVSSTRVRNSVSSGDMEYAGRLLGHPYSVDGRVSHGRKIGRTLEMPTINIVPEPEKLLPPFGVYFSDIVIGTERYHGITNIGVKPTVTDEGRTTVETYIFDFDDDLYGENVRVELFRFHRAEMRFADLAALKRQMHEDMLSGRTYFNITAENFKENL